jgi:hypothetical protein
MATHISRSIHDESDAEAAMPAEAGAAAVNCASHRDTEELRGTE